MSGVRTVAAAAALVLAGSLLPAAPASARRDGDHLPATTTATVPAGGNVRVTTPELPRKMIGVLETTVAVTKDSSADERKSFRSLTHMLATRKTKGEKLLICVRLHQVALSDFSPREGRIVIRQDDSEALALLLLAACIEAAGLLQQDPAPAAARAAERSAARAAARGKPWKCARSSHDLPYKLRTSGGERKLVVRLQPERTKDPLLKVTCRKTKKKLTYGAKATGKRTLNQVVGKRLSVAAVSPMNADAGAPVRFTFDRR